MGENFADLFLFAKILFASMRAPRPLALIRGVANVKASTEILFATLMPAIRENFLPRNKHAIR